jgi:hypothetical protein
MMEMRIETKTDGREGARESSSGFPRHRNIPASLAQATNTDHFECT